MDPEQLFVYWEFTDESLARVRTRLGVDGARAEIRLRVHDTTGRIFDGRNAHGWHDHRVDREDRQRFLFVGRPGSEAFVEIGLLVPDGGRFLRIARSGRVEFPRRSPGALVEPTWMTVGADGARILAAVSPAPGTGPSPWADPTRVGPSVLPPGHVSTHPSPPGASELRLLGASNHLVRGPLPRPE